MIPSRAAREIRTLTRKVVELDRRLAQATLPGTVAEVDHNARRLRLKIGQIDGTPILSPWVRWAEAGNGTLKVHVPPTVGTLMNLISPSGTIGDGSVAHWSTYTDSDASPSSSSDTAMLKLGASSISFGSSGLTLEAGTITLKGDVAAEGGSLTHDGKNVGKDHTHTAVTPGGGRSGPPA